MLTSSSLTYCRRLASMLRSVLSRLQSLPHNQWCYALCSFWAPFLSLYLVLMVGVLRVALAHLTLPTYLYPFLFVLLVSQVFHAPMEKGMVLSLYLRKKPLFKVSLPVVAMAWSREVHLQMLFFLKVLVKVLAKVLYLQCMMKEMMLVMRYLAMLLLYRATLVLWVALCRCLLVPLQRRRRGSRSLTRLLRRRRCPRAPRRTTTP